MQVCILNAAAASLARSRGLDNGDNGERVWRMTSFVIPGQAPLAPVCVCDIQYSSVHANQQQEAIYSCNAAANTVPT